MEEKTNIIFLKFSVIYFFFIIMGTFVQGIISSTADSSRMLVFLGTVIALFAQVLGFVFLSKRREYAKYVLFVGSIYFTFLNLVCTGSEVMLVFIPFCTMGLLVASRETLPALYTVWSINVLLRIFIFMYRNDMEAVSYKNFIWVLFICSMFAMTLSMVYKIVSKYYIEIIQSLSSENKKHQILYEQSKLDSTTNVYNRNAYNEYISNFGNDIKSACCVYVDVNGLHEYNNTYGHQAGDMMLTKVALEMKRCFKNGKAFRLGGDEFVVICEDTQFNEVLKELQSFRHKMKDKNIYVATGLEWREDNISIEDIVKAADIKMYQDKERFYKGNDFYPEKERKTSIYI